MYVVSQIVLPDYLFPFYNEETCYIQRPVRNDKIVLLNNENNSISRLPSEVIYNTEVDETFAEAHYFIVIQNSITKETYEYWRKTDQIVNSIGSLFEVPPASIIRNISNIENGEPVFGFFEVSSVDSSGFYVSVDDVTLFSDKRCPDIPGIEFFNIPFNCFDCLESQLGVDERCIDCELFPNSSHDRPAFIDFIIDN